LPLLLAFLSTFNFQLSTFAQGTAFTYQGRLTDNGAPANGSYDLTFALFNTNNGPVQIGPTLTNSAVALSNGLFTAALDFGPGSFPGDDRWLEIGVRTNGAGAFITLVPRQKLTASPYAMTAGNLTGVVPASSLFGVYPNLVNFINPTNIFLGSFIGNGGPLTNVNAALLNGLASSNFWQLAGNSATTPAANFLGTSDNQPLELRVNGSRALRLEPNTNGAPNLIGGASINFAAPGVFGATIAGGGATNTSFTNSVAANFATIGGGTRNTIQAVAVDSTIAGGDVNTIQGGSYESFIGGGGTQTIQGSSPNSVIAGGYFNTIQSNSIGATIGGGHGQTIQTRAAGATIAGGDSHTIQTNAAYATIAGGSGNFVSGRLGTVPGGDQNVAGTNSFAAGHRAKANDTGTFIWADSTDADFASTSSNQFLIRATGGVGIGTNNPQSALHVAGTITASNFVGPAAGLSGLVADNISSGTLADARLSTNAALLNANQAFSGSNLFSKPLVVTANFAIGTSNPASALHIAGPTNAPPTSLPVADGGLLLGLVSPTGYKWIQSYNATPLIINPLGNNVGIGITNPQTTLHVAGSVTAANFIGPATGLTNINGSVILSNSISGSAILSNSITGSQLADTISLGATNATGRLDIYRTVSNGISISLLGSTSQLRINGNDNAEKVSLDCSPGWGQLILLNNNNPGQFAAILTANATGGGSLNLYNSNGLSRASLFGGNGGGTMNLYRSDGSNTVSIVADDGAGSGLVTTSVLQITGGADRSEQFDVQTADGDLQPGMVVCIDAEHPGQLAVSSKPYHHTVAGIVSGAGGINPGMLMGHHGTAADGKHPVALSGRVYCLADATAAPIQPGDLLTTSATPGHAMKVTDHARAQGAILGKAMASLGQGTGLVLVLVTLQ
jgi:hypothetical protein